MKSERARMTDWMTPAVVTDWALHRTRLASVHLCRSSHKSEDRIYSLNFSNLDQHSSDTVWSYRWCEVWFASVGEPDLNETHAWNVFSKYTSISYPSWGLSISDRSYFALATSNDIGTNDRNRDISRYRVFIQFSLKLVYALKGKKQHLPSRKQLTIVWRAASCPWVRWPRLASILWLTFTVPLLNSMLIRSS